MNNTKRWIAVISGGTLALYGLTRRSPGGIVLVFGGSYLLYRGLTGQHLAYRDNQTGLETESRNPFEQGWQEQPGDAIDPTDIIDEAVWETFPASDPPAWMSSRVR